MCIRDSYGPLKARYERFEAFSRDHLRISGHRYESLEELRQADLPYDLLLSGSDQIWTPKIFPDGRFDPVFFGAFSDRRKIAYAPSFGKMCIRDRAMMKSTSATVTRPKDPMTV